MNEEQVLSIFQACGAILEGHFQLTSGLHSPRYLQCALVLQSPRETERMCRELADRFRSTAVETVIAPALGGILVGYEVARQLGARCLFAEREAGGKMALRRGFQIRAGEKVLVVEDVCTTGGSVGEVIHLVRIEGGTVVGVGALVDRSEGNVSFAVPFQPLLRLEVPAYPPEDCPQCRQDIPVVKPGSRR